MSSYHHLTKKERIELQTVLITGCSNGLGLALTKKFLENGYKVYGIDLEKPDLENCNLFFYEIDLENTDLIQNLISKIGSKIEIFVNNAGIWLEGNLETHSVKNIQKLININLTSAIILTKLILPYFKNKNRGKIAVINSTRGLNGQAEKSVYSSSKFGLRGFTESLREEVASSGIEIFNIYPAGMKTKLFKGKHDMSDYLDPLEVASLIFKTLMDSQKLLQEDLIIQKPRNS